MSLIERSVHLAMIVVHVVEAAMEGLEMAEHVMVGTEMTVGTAITIDVNSTETMIIAEGMMTLVTSVVIAVLIALVEIVVLILHKDPPSMPPLLPMPTPSAAQLQNS